MRRKDFKDINYIVESTIKELFNFEPRDITEPNKLKSGQNVGYTTFTVDGQKFVISIVSVGLRAAKLVDIRFHRDMGLFKKTSELTGESPKTVFKVLSAVINWSVKWLKKNKGFARTYLIGASSEESSRVKLYQKLVEKFAQAENLSYKAVSATDGSGVSRQVYIVFDPEYLEKYPKYKDIVNATLSKVVGATIP